jgi:tRNA A-37 threonylcarbamoyl transferase component Bud32
LGHAPFLETLDKLKEDIAERLQLPPSARGAAVIRARLLRHSSIHTVAALEVGSNGAAVRCFAKSNVANYQGPQRLDREEQFLRDVAPRIWEANQKARSPRVLAFFPRQELLLLEMVEGKSLKKLLFDSRIPNLVQLTGEWLGHLHSITKGEQGDPFEWLENAFSTEKKVRDAFYDCSVATLYPGVLELLRRCRREYAGFRRPQCTVHGEFTSLHVLVKGDSIYVIDFGSSHLGFGYEDVAFFSTFYDILLPWRVAAGYLRFPLTRQKNLFLKSYFEHCEQTWGPADEIVLRFANLRAMAQHESCWERTQENWPASLYLKIARRWVRGRFAALARREFAALQRLVSTSPLVPTPEVSLHFGATSVDGRS